MTGIILALTALTFVFVTGRNDGSALVALGGSQRSVNMGQAAGLLTAVVLVGPVLFGVTVARAFTERVADTSTSDGQLAFLFGVLACLCVVVVCSHHGIPTSLTLALVGGISGGALGLGTYVSWSALSLVLAIGVAAPVFGAALGYGFGRLANRVPSSTRMPRLVSGAHLVVYSVQCAAYAANDGQKMIAVASVAMQSAIGARSGATTIETALPLLVGVAFVFLLGTISALRQSSRLLGGALLPMRPMRTVSAELASSVAVLGSSFIGSPVSMTQSLAAGIVGVGSSQGWRRIRWNAVAQIIVAWTVTLPASFAVAFLAGLTARVWT